jgi:hypothetical protein
MHDHLRQSPVPAVVSDVSEDDSEVYAVGIREAAAPGSWSLSFIECHDAEDPQEIRLGMDTYCLVADPGQAICYGGVTAYSVDGAQLRLTLTEEAAAILGMPTHVSFALDLTPDQADLLNRGLVRGPDLRPRGRGPATTERVTKRPESHTYPAANKTWEPQSMAGHHRYER